MSIKDIKQGFLISLIITLTYLYSFLPNLDKPIELARWDTFHVVITLKHHMDVVFNSRWNDILEVPMFYGFKNSLLFSEPVIFESFEILPFYLITKNIILSFNIVVILTTFLSIYSMFLFTKYLTRQTLPSILASIIYVLNPFVIGHFPDNLFYFSLQWIPLIFLFFEKALNEPKIGKNIFLMFVFMVFQLLTSMTYAALLSVVFPIYVLVRLYQQRLNPPNMINFPALMGLMIFISVTLGLGYFYRGFYSDKRIDQPLETLAAFSPWVSDLFFTAPNNLLYGNLRNKAMEIFPDFVFTHPELLERNLFWGIMPLLLFLASFFVIKRTIFKNLWLISVLVILLCVILSFGPNIRFSKDFALPGLYGLVHNFHPLLQNLRVASRFSIFTFFFLGLISAFVLVYFEKSLKGNLKIITPVAVILLVIFEYWSSPFKFYEPELDVKNLYQALESQKDISVIIELPMGNLLSSFSLTENQFVDTTYMLYASILHSKKLINGYSSYIPPEYKERVEYLMINFPNPVKIQVLKRWGVDAIVLHKDKYFAQKEYFRIKMQLEKLGTKKIYESENLVLFGLN